MASPNHPLTMPFRHQTLDGENNRFNVPICLGYKIPYAPPRQLIFRASILMCQILYVSPNRGWHEGFFGRSAHRTLPSYFHSPNSFQCFVFHRSNRPKEQPRMKNTQTLIMFLLKNWLKKEVCSRGLSWLTCLSFELQNLKRPNVP